jgi:glutamate---cysteine ligase / carboxylate-amine ligase
MTLTFGVEEEFMLVDRYGEVSDASAAVLADAPPADGDLQPELVRCQVESASPVCSTADELLGHLRTQRAQLGKAAERRGLRVRRRGSAPQQRTGPLSLTPEPRYEGMAQHFGSLLESVNICGCHVHVAVPDEETGVQLSNHLRPWLPLLLAVSANSPFSEGKDSGYASWRHRSMSLWPAAGPPPYFSSPDEYRSAVRTMLRTGAIIDERMVYWDIRLSARHPTLEVRVCDVLPTAEDATLIAVLIRALANRALQDIDAAPRIPTEQIQAGLWRAGRDGLAGRCPDPVTGRLVPALTLLHRATEFLDAGEREFVRSTVDRLMVCRGHANRQRSAFARRHRLTDVIDLLAGKP